jgi:hypothetical protein
MKVAMSLKPSAVPPVPIVTAPITHAAFPKRHPHVTLQDEVGEIFDDTDFAQIYPEVGQLSLPL